MAGFSLDQAPHSKPHFEGLEALIKEEQKAAKGMFDLAKGTRLAYEALSDAAARSAASAETAAEVASPRPAASAPTASGKGEAALDAGALTGAIRRAEAPLVGFGRHIDTIFDRVAGTVIEGFRRIDSNTKFPTIDRAFKAVDHAATDTFRFLFGLSKKTRDDVGGTLESVERSIQGLDRSIQGLGKGTPTAPLEAGLKEVSGLLGSIDAGLKTTAESLRALAPAAGPAAHILGEIAAEAAAASAAKPLLAKDFVGVNVPGPGQRPGVRKQGMGAIKPPKDFSVKPDIVPARPAPRLGAAYGGAAKGAADAVRSFASASVAATSAVNRAFRAVNGRVQSVRAALGKIPVRAIVSVVGTAALAARSIGAFTARVGGARAALGVVAGAAATAFGVIVPGVGLAQAGFVGLTAATGLSGFEMVALAARAAGVTAVLAKVGRAAFNLKFLGSSLGDVSKKTFSQMYGGVANLINPFKLLTKQIGGTKSATAQVTASVKGMAGEIAAALGIVAVVSKVTGGIKDFFLGGIKGASDLAETISASKATFGDFAGSVESQADSMARAYGLNRKAQIDIATGYGEMAQGAGMAEGESAKFANTFTQLAADFNSRNNFDGGIAEAAEKIQSALAGQSEPLRRYGVLIDEDAVKNYALANGLAKSSKSISDQAKFAARAALIQQGLASSSGDLEKTAGGAANQFRKAGGGLENFATTVGQLLLPAVTAGTRAFNELLAVIVDAFEANRPMFEAWAAKAEEAMGLVAAGVRNLGAVWTLVQDYAVRGVADVVAVFGTLPDNFNIITKYVGENWSNLCKDLVRVMASTLGNLYDNLTRLGDAIADFFTNPTKGFHFDWANEWRPMLAGFERTSAKFPGLIKPEFMAMGDDAKAALDKIQADYESHRAAAGGEAARAKRPAPIDPTEKEKKQREPGLAGLAEANSKEAYSAVVRHQFRRGDDGMKELTKTAEKQYDETKEQTALLKLIATGKRGKSSDDISLAILSL